MRSLAILVGATLCFACGGSEDEQRKPPPPPITKPLRGAVGDTDLRVMLAEIASSKACDMMRGQFRPLRAPDRPETNTGVLWIRECKITNDGTKVTFNLGGHGWQWAHKKQKKAGATFEVKEYVKFAVDAKIPGSLDIAYDRDKHIVSLWFSPTAKPQVEFTPVGDVDVDEKGLWGEVIGGVSSVFLQSPDAQGKKQADKEGTNEFTNQLGRGMTVAIDLCTGYQRFTTGRPQKGDLGPADAGESKKVPNELQPGGLLVFGPYMAPHGMTVDIETNGFVRAGLACVDDIDRAAEAFVGENQPVLIDTLDQADVNGKAHLAVKPQKCKVALVVRSRAQTPVTFTWQRPAKEIARSTGGRVIRCDRDEGISSKRDDSGVARPASTRRR